MEFVCEDTDGSWYYLPDKQAYHRIHHGIVRGAITGKHLPDPSFLLVQRKKLYPQAREQDIAPTEATYKLWEHWNAQQEIANGA